MSCPSARSTTAPGSSIPPSFDPDMEKLIHFIKTLVQPDQTLEIYDSSYAEAGEVKLLMAHLDGRDVLFVEGGWEAAGFQGQRLGALGLCELTHQNRLAASALLPYANPTAMGREKETIGLGDRLACANYAHLKSLESKDIYPILAQQSKRELKLTGRSYADVLDAAVWAVLKAGWKYGFGADGDHLKNIGDIRGALEDGYSMITLDCSEALQPIPESDAALEAAYQALAPDERISYEHRYLGGGANQPVEMDRRTLMQAAVCFRDAIALAVEVYRSCIQPAGREIDFELSLDETAFPTLPAYHYFVAGELAHAQVSITSMAPRFVGEFQKGIDYIGSLDAFRTDFAAHAAIADHFGYKLSVHSGSDKFSVFAAVGELSRHRVHVKTSGTSWLEAVRVIARADPALYRDMHRNALAHLEEARANYVVHADVSHIRPLDEMPDARLPAYLEEDDARQLMHITYGNQLRCPEIRQRLFRVLEERRKEYEACVTQHIRRHIEALGVPDRK